MPGTRYLRRDFIFRLHPESQDHIAVEIGPAERAAHYSVPRQKVKGFTEQTSPAEIAGVLFSFPVIGTEYALWQQARSSSAEGLGGTGQQVERICLRVDDERLAALPLEQALVHALAGLGARPAMPTIPRLVPVPPRVAQVPFTLPLRLLQLERRGDFDLPGTVNAVFHSPPQPPPPAAALLVAASRAEEFAGWALPTGWRTVDVLHLDQLPALPERRLLAMASTDEPGTLGWLVRCTDLWRTRLVVIRGGGKPDMGLLRRLAHRLTGQGGPAVWLVDDGPFPAPLLLQRFYAKLIHDAPVDIAVTEAFDGQPPLGTLFLGAGREELLRVSSPGDDFAAMARGLGDTDPQVRADVAGKLWSTIAANNPDLHGAAETFAKTVRGVESIAGGLGSWNFDIHEGEGMVPLGEEIARLRQATRATTATAAEVRPTARRAEPRFVNIALWGFDSAIGRGEPIAQPGACLRQGEPIVLGVQLGPHAGYAPVLDALALIEEPLKWEEGREGVWLSVAVTGLDFTVTGAAIQEVWLPRYEASDLIEFVVEPGRKGVSQLRLCIYYGADLLQAHRLAARVDDAANGAGATTSQELASALGVEQDRVGGAGWLARMEYAAAADLGAPPADRDVALSVFANDLGGRRVFTVRGTEGYEVLLAGDTSGLASDVRAKLDAVSRDASGFYAFLQRGPTPLHGATPQQRDAALQGLAQVGWTLYAAIFAGADRDAMASDLAGERRVIHVAHSLLENVIPWAAIYDRPYDMEREKSDSGLPVQRSVCPAGLPDAAGRFVTMDCGVHPTCPMSPQGRAAAAAAGQGIAEDAIVCARHFWGFRHIVELPPYQEDGSAAAAGAAGASAAPPRRAVTSAGNPVNLLLGYNAALGTVGSHRAELQALLAGRKLSAIWNGQENSRDGFLTALRRADADLVYLFCHARGGLADPATRPPALELQATVGSPPSLIRAAALASGLHLTHHPLFILNGCNTAAFSPDALSPFIRTLVRDCDAAGALGTEIPVFELLAGEVGRQFLTRFLDGASAGEALLDIRRDLLARGNPMGLAYTLYAVAELKIVQ